MGGIQLSREIHAFFERDVIDRMKKTQKTGKRHFIIIVAEGVGGVEEMAKKIEAKDWTSNTLLRVFCCIASLNGKSKFIS